MPKVGAAPLTTLWFSALTSAIDASSESINAPDAVTFASLINRLAADVAAADALVAALVALVLAADAAATASADSSVTLSVFVAPSMPAVCK